jgi:hypothetical protein
VTDPVTGGPDGAPYLAVDVQPDNLAGVFTLDVSELDGPDVLGWTAEDAGTWVNVVCDVLQVDLRRGATRHQGLLTRAESGTVTIQVRDEQQQLDPLTTGEQVHKGTPLRLRAWGFDLLGDPWEEVLFTGEVDELFTEYDPQEVPLVTITGVDLIAVLSLWESEGYAEPGVGAGDDPAERVERVFAEVGRGELSAVSDTVYATTLNPTVLSHPWDVINSAVDAELGRAWVDRDNRLVLQARSSELAGPVRGTLSTEHGDGDPHCCMSAASVVFGQELLTNRAIGTRREPTDGAPQPATFRRDDTYSQARYGVGAVNATLEVQNDAQVQAWAEAMVVAGARPELRVDSVSPAPPSDDLDTALDAWPAVMATDLGDRWLFRYHPLYGSDVERTVGVLGIEMTLTPEDWSVLWTTREAPTPGHGGVLGWFVLDASELDSGDLLAPFSQPVAAP